jgi:transcriptional regulator with XRE-family HTH domain
MRAFIEKGQRRVVQWYLKDWRVHRKLRQHQVAERMGTSVSMVSAQETGAKRLNDDWIDKWAQAIGARPIDLLRPPTETDLGLELPSQADAERLRRAIALFQSIDPAHQDNFLNLLESLPRRAPKEG